MKHLNPYWHLWLWLAVILGNEPIRAQMPDLPGQPAPGTQPVHAAYLFAHMMQADYGHLYYSVSLDGLHWQLLNGGHRVFESYRGHASICRGHDGRYYLAGNRSDDDLTIHFWASTNLVTWAPYSDYTADVQHTPGYEKALARLGAPKLFYDETSHQYLVTWHTPHDLGKTDMPEPYWASQRTLYALSPDLKTFSPLPQRLFPWDDLATIDVNLQKMGDTYYAF
ncbi:MAG TPA: glycosyl hydrolase family 43, partial [Verrucomicrobiae bacterium]